MLSADPSPGTRLPEAGGSSAEPLHGGVAEGTGVMALIEAQRPRAERSSLVRTAAEGFAAALAGRLTAMTGREVDVRLEGVSRPDRAAPPDPRSAAIFFECLPHDGGAGTLRIGGGLLQPCLDLAMGDAAATAGPQPHRRARRRPSRLG